MAKTKKKTSKKESKYLKNLWKAYFIVLGFLVVFFTMLSFGWLGFMPSFEELENPHSNQASEVYSSDGQILGYIGVQNRSNVSYSELPQSLLDALIATEDVRFYNHSGIDLRSLFRVLGKTVIRGQKQSGGGSTLSQQLAKNLFPRERKSKIGLMLSKLKEWVVAIKLERNYTKDEILVMYLNTVDFGSNAFGIKTASKTFFDKAPEDLDIEESAVLVGILKAPSAYSPIRQTERSRDRRNVVLSQMNKYKYIDAETYEELKETELDMSNYNPQTHDEGIATYFREYIRNYLKEWSKKHLKPDGEPYDVHKDGLKIYTTIDYRMQKYAEEAVREHFAKTLQPQFFSHSKGFRDAPFTGISQQDIEKNLLQAMKHSDRYRALKNDGYSESEIRQDFSKIAEMRVFSWDGDIDTVMTPWDSLRYYKFFLNTGVVSIEPQSGHVKVYIGGINYKAFKFDNASLGRRQVGSTFKPFVYASAMYDSQLSPCFLIPNQQITFEDFDDWTPKNSNQNREGEMVSLKWALANSINFVSARLIKDYTTPSAVVDLVKQMGISSPIPSYPSICLGTPDLSVMEMASAMSTFANKGVHIEPIMITKITDNKGVVLESFGGKSHKALDEETAYLVLDLMKGVVESGTGVRLRYRYGVKSVVAGKTGTTDNNSDGWFIGVNPGLATAVWVGGEVRSIHFRSTSLGQGASMALPIYALFLQKAEKDPKLSFYKGDFQRPSEISVEMDCSQYQQELKEERSSETSGEYYKDW